MTMIIRPPQFNRPSSGPTAGAPIVPGNEPRDHGNPAGDQVPSPVTLTAFLEHWLADIVRLSVRPKTFVSYRSVVRLHLAPALGDIPLTELRPGEQRVASA
jgi:hypothetical protein